MNPQKFTNFIGIDVSKDKIDIFSSLSNNKFQVENCKNSILKAFKGFDNSNSYVVLENTGGYEKTCINALIDLNFTIHRTDNRKAKNFMKSLKGEAKTDVADAQKLSRYGKDRYEELSVYIAKSDNQEKLRELSLYLQELKKFKTSEKTRLQSPGCEMLKTFINRTIDGLNQSIESVEKEIAEISNGDSELQSKIDLLCQYKGIKKLTALKLLSFMPELGTLNRREVAALAGLAPIANDSGKKLGYRKTKGARASVRQALFMVALSCVGKNKKGEIKEYYTSMISRGKKKMVAITACMRKIIIQINAILRDKQMKNEK